MPRRQLLRASLCALAVLVFLPAPARADITMRVWVRLITAGQCKIKRTIDTNGHSQVVYESLDCSVAAENPNNSYYFETHLEGNVIEQIVDAAQVGKAIYDFAGDVAAAVGSAGGAAALAGAKAANDIRTAYNEFNQLMDGWGGKAKYTSDQFVVENPNGRYRWVEVIFSADSDNDPFERSVLAPASALPGMTIERITDTRTTKFFKLVVDLTQLPMHTLTIPMALAVAEGDCSASCLKISKVLNLIVERPEDGPLVAATTIGYQRRDAGCDVCGFARRDSLARTRLGPTGARQGEVVQQTTVSIRQSAGGAFAVLNNGRAENFDQLYIGMALDSQRLKSGNRIELAADCLGACPPGLARHVDGVTAGIDANRRPIEGTGAAYFTFDPRALPFGTTTLVFNASYEAGHGGTIAQHVVKVVKEAAVAVNPRAKSATAAATADRAATTPKPMAPLPMPKVTSAVVVTPDISGRWKSSAGLVYDVTQKGGTFTWTVASLGQTATGTITGQATTATWTDRNGKGTAKGVVKATDASGRATRIEWDNGVVFTR